MVECLAVVLPYPMIRPNLSRRETLFGPSSGMYLQGKRIVYVRTFHTLSIGICDSRDGTYLQRKTHCIF